MVLLCMILTTFGSLHIILHLFVGSFYVIGIFTIGYGGYYANILSLGLVFVSWLCFYINIIQFFGENHEGYALRVLGVVYWQVRNLCSSIHSLSCLRSTVTLSYELRVIMLVFPPCCLEGFSPVVGMVDSSLPMLVPPSEPLIIQSPILINGTSYIMSGIWLTIMSWWNSVDSG
jgi:hypothetical protein